MKLSLRCILLVPAVIAVVAACDRSKAEPAARVRASADSLPAGSVIDSLLPLEETLRRFRDGLPVVTELRGGAPSLDSLIAAVLGSLERNDTTALLGTAITRAEYAYLYYPTSIYAGKPYELAPDIAWMLSIQSSEKGRSRLVQRLGGHALRSGGHRCDKPLTEVANRIWRDCIVAFVDPATSTTVTRKLFGSVIERGGSFKLLSFANDF